MHIIFVMRSNYKLRHTDAILFSTNFNYFTKNKIPQALRLGEFQLLDEQIKYYPIFSVGISVGTSVGISTGGTP